MNRNYAVQIRHHRTGEWTTITHSLTTASEQQIQQEFEQRYGQQVRIVEMPQSQVEAHFDVVARSIVATF